MKQRLGGKWAMGLCPNPRCHRVVVRMTGEIDLSAGLFEIICKRCGKRAVYGEGADLEVPARPQVIQVTSLEMFRRYRGKGQTRDIDTRHDDRRRESGSAGPPAA